jgi:SsrA-binding protein
MSTLASNKHAYHDYEVLEEFEAGIALRGWEVKSVKNGLASLKEGHVTLRGGEAFLLNAYINPWPGMPTEERGQELRERKLLLNHLELNKLQKGMSIRGNTLVPLDMHLFRNKVKLKLALVRGRKRYDKRAKLKEQDQKRALERDIKQFHLK